MSETPGNQLVKDVEYHRHTSGPLTLDLYETEREPKKPRPVIVWIHGGGWNSGEKASAEGPIAGLVTRGYLGVAIQYRMSDVARFPAQLADCKCAIRYLRAHAGQLRIDPRRIGVWGSSAGGHLAALLGLTAGVAEFEGEGWEGYPSDVQAVCDWFGPSDLLLLTRQESAMDHAGPNSPGSRLVGGPVNDREEAARRASPVTYVRSDCPPFLIMHGTADRLVPPGQSDVLYRGLKSAGADVAYIPVKGAGHGIGQFQAQELLDQVYAFMNRVLWFPD